MSLAYTAYEFRIYPTIKQEILLAKTFGCCRFVYNKLLDEKKIYYLITGDYWRNTPTSLKKYYPWLKEVDSLALCNEQLHLETAFKNFFRDPKHVGYPKHKSKARDKKSYTTNVINRNIKLIDNRLKLPKLGLVRIVAHREVCENGKLKSVTVTQDKAGAYFASLLYEYEKVVPNPVEPKTVLGLDYASDGLYVDSDGNGADYPKFYRKGQEKLKKEQKKLSRKKKCSKNRAKQRKKVAKAHRHVRNQRKDFLNKRSRMIANSFDAVIVEDLNMKGLAQCLNLGKSTHDNGWGIFLLMLAYKLANLGKHLVRVDRFFPSTKTCSCCGKLHDMPLSKRVYECECGLVMDRDRNAAINIRNEGMRLLQEKNRGTPGVSLLNIRGPSS